MPLKYLEFDKAPKYEYELMQKGRRLSITYKKGHMMVFGQFTSLTMKTVNIQMCK